MTYLTTEETLKMMVGKTVLKINDVKANRETMCFVMEDESVFILDHFQDCCESVTIEDICGDMEDLIGSPILQADEVVSTDAPNLHDPFTGQTLKESCESATWTFYKFATIKGSVTVRWLGESNGYYSESVNATKYDNLSLVPSWTQQAIYNNGNDTSIVESLPEKIGRRY